MTINELVALYNKDSEVIESDNGSISLSRISISDILENQNKAYNELITKTREELIDFITDNFFREHNYTELVG